MSASATDGYAARCRYVNSTRSSRRSGSSSGCGSLTLQTSSAAQASSAVGTTFAPAAWYSPSSMADDRPAPVSTRTSTPCSQSSRTPSGVIATRCSLFLTSPGTPTVRVIWGPFDGGCAAAPSSIVPAPSARVLRLSNVGPRSCSRLLSSAVSARIAVHPEGSPGWFTDAVVRGGGTVVPLDDAEALVW